LLLQLTSRKDDLRRYGDASVAALQRKIEIAERDRRLASNKEAMSKAQARHKKLLTEMDKLRVESQAEMKSRLAEIEAEERRIRLSQFVDVSPQFLFRVEQVKATEETLA
jgi:hypothetical protein